MPATANQVKPAERLVFRNGKLADPDHENANCGCVDPVPVLRAETITPVPPPIATPPPASPAPPPPSVPAVSPVHIEVDAPFVYRAEEDPGPSPLAGAFTVHVVKNPPIFLVTAPPPPVIARANVPNPAVDTRVNNRGKRSGFLGRVKGFFAAIFH